MKLNTNPYSEEQLRDAWNNGYENIDLISSNKEIMFAWKQGFLAKKEDLLKIPKGPYCYHGSAAPKDPNYCRCPFWELRTVDSGQFKGETYGYCSLLKCGDFSEDPNQETTLLLHDQVKECGLNSDWEDS